MHDLVDVAHEAYENAHAPYSEYPVGAALLTADGTLFTGCNIENANYTNTLHAEEVALASAIKRGFRSFEAVAVATPNQSGVTPCGMCRQTLAEFGTDDLVVLVDDDGNIIEYTLGELLPARGIPGIS